MKKLQLPFLLLLVSITALYSQNNSGKIWSKASLSECSNLELIKRNSDPIRFTIFKLNINSIKELVQNAPERDYSNGISDVVISFPKADGTLERYKIFKSSIMEAELQAKYPIIQTYAAIGIDDPTASMRFSITQFGLHTMSLSGTRSAEYIEPFTKNMEYYIVYDRSSVLKDDTEQFICSTDSGFEVPKNYSNNPSVNRGDTNDNKMRTYRLAQSCSAEYGNIFAGSGTTAQKKANIQAQMTITINRVNTIYERDLAIHLNFVNNNDAIIYFGNTAADPWNGEYNTTTQTVIDTAIGNANYDIGHNFNTSGGGNAGCIGCVCHTGDKGSGMTGRNNPTGDAFDIDYVAHEMGHQFGGYHTFNDCNGSSGNGTTEVEPASGSSIMSYAGICPVDVQSNSDAHFNYVSIRDISSNIQNGVSTCGAQTNLNNAAPVANAGNNRVIPKSTAFILDGTATDADGTASLTYSWYQTDPQASPSGPNIVATNAVGPMYRAKLPTSSTKRYMPSFEDVFVGNLTPQWEKTPSVERSLHFAFLVRDNGATGGQTDADLMTVYVRGTAGPFLVTSQNSSETWNTGETKSIAWDVAGTTANGINAANVDIYLVDEQGNILSTLITNTANDGNENITVPNITNNNVKVMVKASDNIFYALSGSSVGINSAPAGCNSVCDSNGRTGCADCNDGITRVSINTIDNSSPSAPDYSDFKNITTDLTQNNTYDLIVEVNTAGNYNEAAIAWIDWNHDCDFNDAGEEYIMGTANNTPGGAVANSPMSITVPAGATLGSTTMRVSAGYTTNPITYPTSCQVNFFGEVEDYTINVLGVNGISDSTLNETVNLYQTESNININTTNGSNIKKVLIYDLLGKRLVSQLVNTAQVSIDGVTISQGTLLLVKVVLENDKVISKKLLYR